jgi:hypothetical protein
MKTINAYDVSFEVDKEKNSKYNIMGIKLDGFNGDNGQIYLFLPLTSSVPTEKSSMCFLMKTIKKVYL